MWVVKGARWGHFPGFWLVLAVANRKCNRWPLVAKGMAGSKPLTRGKKESWAHGTGSHVFLEGKPLTSIKNGSWAQVGRKVQSPILGTGVILGVKTQKKKLNTLLSNFSQQQVREKKWVQSLNWIWWLATMSGGMIPWRETPGRGRGQNDELCKPGSGTESKVQCPGKEYKSIRKVIICEQIILT